jgi:hypothetical protein
LHFVPQYEHEHFGFIIFGSDYAYIALEKSNNQMFISIKENIMAYKNNSESVIATFPIAATDYYLGIKVESGAVCHFQYSTDGIKYTTIDKPFIAKPGRWVGAKIGTFCLNII